MRLLSLDPGTTTGWAMFRKPNNRDGYTSGQIRDDQIWGLLETARWDSVDVVLPLGDFVRTTKQKVDLTIICESFQYRQLPKAVLTPVEVIGVVKEWARQNEVEVIFQTPAQGKFYFSDTRLKAMGLWKPGKPHAMDAMRHLLYFLGFGQGVVLGQEVVRKS